MLPTTERPRERLQAHGDGHLADAELISLVLGKSSTTIAEGLLLRFPDLRRMAVAGIGELAQVQGVGVAQACRLKAALALATRLGERPFVRGEPIAGPVEVWRRMARRLATLEREIFIAIALDARNRVLCELRLAEGGSCSLELLPRDVFTTLLREAASGVIFVHNHPSGDPAPSDDDRVMTRRLRDAGELVGLRVLDHVIVAADGYRADSTSWS